MKIKDAFITDREQDIELQEAERTFKAYMVRDLVERDLESMSLGEIYQRASTALYNEYMCLDDDSLKIRFNDAFRGEFDHEM